MVNSVELDKQGKIICPKSTLTFGNHVIMQERLNKKRSFVSNTSSEAGFENL